MNDSTLTPMMAQYRRIRAGLPKDTLLFFRLGDFYEMFFEDAVDAARILDITLTKRHKTPMCGVPYHAAESYIARLLRAHRKVAICEQMEDPALTKGLVRRDITRVITPGTVLEEQVLDAQRNNYLAGLAVEKNVLGLALLELSTGAFWVEEFDDAAALGDLLAQVAPSECVVPEGWRDDPAVCAAVAAAGATASPLEDWVFQVDTAREVLLRHFRVHSLDGFGCGACGAAVAAAGAVLHYVTRELRRTVDHVRSLRFRRAADFLVLDDATVGHLELVAGRGPAGRSGGPCLLKVLNATRTSMGGRLMREWMLRPLARLEALRARHDAVEALTKDRTRLHTLRERLGEIRDLERLVARLSVGTGNARDVRAVAQSLRALPGVKELAEGHPAALLADTGASIELQPELAEHIERAIEEEPALSLKEGGLIRRGYHEELDRLREAATEGRRWLAEYQASEQERTGLKTLKVRHNKVFGYYIEVTKSQADAVPAAYIRKQTLVNAERFITPELKEYENRILGAHDRAVELEYELFLEVRAAVTARLESLQRSAEAVAALDVLGALADRALALRYVRPVMTDGTGLWIREGRHPVIEQLPDAERFVPNDTRLDGAEHQIMIITGPNMAGKSTYIRQVALVVILAQMGSFVPASEAELGLVDRVFTRVGASDDLARGRSTFMVEMQETANILNNATPRSLIVLDEIGRGTSTFDGISIAWAVAEHLHTEASVKAKTLFATHYHELTDLALTMPGVKNYNVLVREKDDKIAFLRKIVPGGADKSYGIQVARLAGMPPAVIERAKEILGNLEEGEFGEAGQPKLAVRRGGRKPRAASGQMSLF